MTDHCAAPQAEPTQSPREHMNLTFGLALEGFRHAPDAVALGELTCGPAGILGWLEARLGLARRWPSTVERLMAYERALAAASRGSFYFESFDKDPLAVAETLLGWRDELILSGWARNPAPTGAPRPDALFALETRVDSVVRTGIGDRVLEVLAALPTRPITIESLVVVDDRSHLPVLWQRLLDSLGAQWAKPNQPRIPSAEASGPCSCFTAARRRREYARASVAALQVLAELKMRVAAELIFSSCGLEHSRRNS